MFIVIQRNLVMMQDQEYGRYENILDALKAVDALQVYNEIKHAQGKVIGE